MKHTAASKTFLSGELMIQRRFAIFASVAILSASLIASCNHQKTDFSSLPPVTQVSVTEYNTTKKPYGKIVWRINDPQKITRLVALVDAQKARWSDMNSAIISSQTGVELKFNGPKVNRTFVIYPKGFNNAYSTAQGNIWAMEGEYPNVIVNMVIKEIPEPAIDNLLSDIKAVTNGTKPAATAPPIPTTHALPTVTAK